MPAGSESPQESRSQDDVHHLGNSFRSSPVALQLAGQGHPAYGLRPRLDNALKSRSVRLRGGPAYSIDDRIHLVAFMERIQSWERQADFCPKGGHHQLLPARRLDGLSKIAVFPGIDLSAVDLD